MSLEQMAYSRLVELITWEAKSVVVVPAVALRKHLKISRVYGDFWRKVAELTTDEFGRSKLQCDWEVVYMPGNKCFVAVKKSYVSKVAKIM